jgi:hypothetical protein
MMGDFTKIKKTTRCLDLASLSQNDFELSKDTASGML